MSRLLLAYLSGTFSDADVAALRWAAAEMGAGGSWTIEPPAFVDELDESSCTRPDDVPLRTVGVALRVTAAEDSPGTPAEEAFRFVDAMARYSRERNLEMELQLGRTYVGEIRSGVPDRLLNEGLLATW